jgi:hypothetical protein
MRDLARRLLNYEEAEAGGDSESTDSAVLRVYEKLRRSLSALAGVAGFRSLASRALILARRESPVLSVVQITADGYLQGVAELKLHNDEHQSGKAEVLLISQLLGLLFTFVGEGLTLRLLQDVWPDEALDDSSSGIGRKL